MEKGFNQDLPSAVKNSLLIDIWQEKLLKNCYQHLHRNQKKINWLAISMMLVATYKGIGESLYETYQNSTKFFTYWFTTSNKSICHMTHICIAVMNVCFDRWFSNIVVLVRRGTKEKRMAISFTQPNMTFNAPI